MGNLCSFSIIRENNFLDIVRVLDKAQKKAHSNELNSNDIIKALEYFSYYTPAAEKVYVEVIGGYSFSGYKFPSHCSKLTITRDHVTASRIVAPSTFSGRGDRFKVHLINRNDTPLSLLRFISSHFIEYSPEHIIIGIPGNRAKLPIR